MVLFVMIVVAGLSFVGCDEQVSPAPVNVDIDDGLRIVTTTTMLDDLVRTLVGDRIEVIGLMKPGQDPHVYDVLPRDAQAIADADLIVANGLNLEATLKEVIQANAQGKVVYAAEQNAIQPLGSEDYAGAPDPHCWMDVSLYRFYALAVFTALVEIDPANAAEYEQRAVEYVTQLGELDAYARQRFEEIPREQRVIVTSHDAFNYFGAAYGIDVHGVVGISTEQAPRPQDIAELENLIKDRNVKALFIESSTTPTLNAVVEKVAAQANINIGGTLYSDSLGRPGSGAETYLGMIRHNIDTVVEALK